MGEEKQSPTSLYAISGDLLAVIENGIVFDEETGEVYFDEGDVDALAERLADKVEAVQVVSREKRGRADFLRREAKRLESTARALENAADSLDAYAVKCVSPLGRIETAHYTIGTRTTDAVQVLDESAVPSDYLRVKTSMSVDKAAVKRDLKAGVDVPGCALVKNVHLSVR